MKSTKAYKGMAMEGPVAAWYAKVTQNEQRHRLLAERLAGKIAPGSQVLEIAPGPGYFSMELARLGDFQVTGLDISQSFVEIARKNALQAGVKVDFRQGNASDMPFADESFDFMFCQAAFKNFFEPVKAIDEMYRVLRPHGSAVIVDLRRDASRSEIERHIESLGQGRINRFITKWTFQQVLLKSAYTIAEMEAFVSQTPFRKCSVDPDDIGFSVWLEK
jgi:ubiquinone/menaquinone biosynthesis C-methylase UbiE